VFGRLDWHRELLMERRRPLQKAGAKRRSLMEQLRLLQKAGAEGHLSFATTFGFSS
jgi:hypothetical protein